MDLSYTLLPVSQIDSTLRRRMFDLFGKYYFDVEFERFNSDLSEKTSVIMLWDRSKSSEPFLFGFSTILIRELPEGGRVIYSGDTVVDSDYWGSRTLQSAFTRVLFLTRLRHPFAPLYWMLISKGFKTYMLMRRNFPRSYPSLEGAIPADLASVKHTFYNGKFSGYYKSETSLIDFGKSLGRVKDQMAVPTTRDLSSADVRYFLEKNPRYHEGVELACIADIRWTDIVHIICKYTVPFYAKVRSRIAASNT
ncbi:hypothetical protein [Bdellovibrio sp. BCCA]|uniref:hypothetical protein n=1 Tax=unclassified Bdellovibrio TaxID=2633795 RepID=UPI0025E88BCC|nr:hypothetical protein [uncultured Bdellovibrio sp.]